jgi:hypothetical protein
MTQSCSVRANIARTARAFAYSAIVIAFAAAATGCSPKLGSEGWCTMMNDKPKGDWSGNDAAAYTKHCVLGIKPED